MYSSLINAAALHENQGRPDWVIVDCRYDLADPQLGGRVYRETHIAGAVFADVHDDLSGPPLTDNGRHPLPAAEQLNRLFSRLGINHDTQVVAYDQVSGSFAGRLWWLLRYMGHEAVAVLDGGWPAWVNAGLPVRSGEETNKPGSFQGTPQSGWLVTANQVPAVKLLVDSRDPARYRGEVEPIDPVAGHIPGAINRFWQENLDGPGLFKAPGVLRSEFMALLGKVSPEEAVFYCGSGVTACHNLLAATHAGLPLPKLYAGSWSDWCSAPERPVAKGDESRNFS